MSDPNFFNGLADKIHAAKSIDLADSPNNDYGIDVVDGTEVIATIDTVCSGSVHSTPPRECEVIDVKY